MFLNEKIEGRNPEIAWKFLESNVPIFNPVTGKCRLCLREKFNIVLKPNLASLNQRQEVFANCRHKITSLIAIPPDLKVKVNQPISKLSIISICIVSNCLPDDWEASVLAQCLL